MVFLNQAAFAQNSSPWKVALYETEPFAQESSQGEAEGYLVDLWREIAENSGKTVQFRIGSYQQTVAWLRDGDVDFHGGLRLGSLDRETSDALAFGQPIAVSCQSLFYVEGSTALAHLEDRRLAVADSMADSGLVLEQGTTLEDVAAYDLALRRLADRELDLLLGPTQAIKRALARSGERVEERALHCPWLVPASLIERANEASIPLTARERLSPTDFRLLDEKWRAVSSPSLQPPSIVASADQLAWLATHASIRLGASPWVPMTEIGSQGQLTGLGLETVRAVFAKIGVLPVFVSHEDWSVAVTDAMTNVTDGLGYTMPTDDKREALAFTQDLVAPPFVIATNTEAPFMRGLGDLDGARLAIPQTYALVETIYRDYPNIEVVKVENAKQGLLMLANGGVEAYFDILPTITQVTNRLGLKNLKMAAKSELTSGMACGVRRDWPQLVELLDKSIDVTTNAELQQIYESWDRVRFEPHRADRRIVLLTAALVAFPLLALLAFQGHRTIRHRRLAEEKEKILQRQVLQLQKLEAVGTLAKGVAHDFNNILTAILGYADLAIEDMPADSESRGWIKRIVQSSVRAQELVSRIRAFSHNQWVERETLDLSHLINDTAQLLKASLPATIRVVHHLPDTAAHVLGNTTQIQQAIMNLATNSVAAMPEGGLLEISLNEVDDTAGTEMTTGPLKAGRYWRLSVVDEGEGISSEHLPKIFDPFFTTKPVGTGSGLGLSTVHGIVSTHTGGIHVASELDKGTRFEVYLPWAPAPAAPAATQETTNPAPLKASELCILIVDDEPFLTDVVGRCLQSVGYKTRCFNESPDALEAFTSEPSSFDLIVSDLTMPDLSGEELAAKASAVRPDIPIILMTGYPSQVVQAQVELGHIRQVLEKPMKPKLLLDAVSRQLS